LEQYIASLDLQTPEQAFRDLVEQKKIDEALESLKMLLDEKSAQQIIDHVKKLVAEGNQEEAVAALKRYIQASDLVVNVQTTLVRVIARFLEEIEQYAAAEKAYRQFAQRSKQPEAILEVAAFLARRDRIDEALAICDAAWKTCDPRMVAQVSVGTLRTTGKPTPAQIQRVEAQLTTAIEKAASEHWMQLVTTLAAAGESGNSIWVAPGTGRSEKCL
jgi:tetratricopeptide (TPR) repeat protein